MGRYAPIRHAPDDDGPTTRSLLPAERTLIITGGRGQQNKRARYEGGHDDGRCAMYRRFVLLLLLACLGLASYKVGDLQAMLQAVQQVEQAGVDEGGGAAPPRIWLQPSATCQSSRGNVLAAGECVPLAAALALAQAAPGGRVCRFQSSVPLHEGGCTAALSFCDAAAETLTEPGLASFVCACGRSSNPGHRTRSILSSWPEGLCWRSLITPRALRRLTV